MGGHDGSWEVSLGRVVQGLLYCRATVARRGWRSWPVPCAALVLLSSCFLFGAISSGVGPSVPRFEASHPIARLLPHHGTITTSSSYPRLL